MTIPQDLAVLLTAVAIFASHWLQTDKLSPRANALIAVSCFLVMDGGTVWLITGFGGSVRQVILTIVAATVFLGYNELQPLLQYLNSLPSPLAPKAGKVRATVQDWNKYSQGK